VCGQQALCLDRLGMVWDGWCMFLRKRKHRSLRLQVFEYCIVDLYWIILNLLIYIYIYIIILKLYIIYYHMFNWFFLHFILVSPAHRILRSFSGVDPSSSIHLRTLQEFHKNIWINLIISYNHSPTWNKVIGDVSSYYLLLTITLVTSQWRRYL